jgi:hypothetical protein
MQASKRWPVTLRELSHQQLCCCGRTLYAENERGRQTQKSAIITVQRTCNITVVVVFGDTATWAVGEGCGWDGWAGW